MNPRAVLVLIVLAASSCTSPSTESTNTVPPSTTLEPITTTTTTLTGPLSASQVFEAVSPGLAFIETAIGTGSGVLMENGKLLTNAHVVWPFAEARVVFPDGTELTAAPVIAWDVMGDMAVLDVASAPNLPDPVVFGDGESESIGTRLYLIGYPAEVDQFPQPTLTSGLLARFRTWDAIGMTYLQTDAVIAGGQSGGALVSDRGEVVGISGLLFAEGFALAASAPDVLPRIEAVLGGDPLEGLGTRLLPGEAPPVTEAEAPLVNYFDEATWVFSPAAGESVSVEASSAADISVAVVSADGFVELFVDDSAAELETGSFEVVVAAPHILVVTSAATTPTTATVKTDVPIRAFIDPDHGREVAVGETTTGNVDYPTDVDYFLVELDAGQTVTIEVDSMNFDADLVIDLVDNAGNVIGSDADSGGGVMGWDPLVTFTAEQTGTYLVGIYDQSGVGSGGYFLRVGSG